MKHIEHVGIAVKDMAAAQEQWQLLLNRLPYKEEVVESEGVRTLFFETGESKIELLEAMNADSPIAKFIEKRGEGIHHIALSVKDIKYEMSRLKEAGFVLLSEEPKLGADNKWVCFVHPKSSGGVLLELVQEVEI